MAVEPKVEVIKNSTDIQQVSNGMASRIAIVGAFDSIVSDLTVVTDKTTAHSIFGTTDVVDNFKGTDAIDFLFYGATELLVANVTTWSDDETPVPSTTITNEKLDTALAKLHHEEFDILFIAEDLADVSQVIVTKWLSDEFKDKYCHGQIIQLNRSSGAEYATSVGTLGDNTYYINTQQFNYLGTNLSLNQSTAYMAGLIASMGVNRSLTAKTIPNIQGISPEYLTTAGELGAKLLELNIPFIKAKNRRLDEYICVNSRMPNELDLYINRTRDYVINRIAVESYLGEINNERTVEGIHNIVDNLVYECVDILELLEEIDFVVERKSSECIDIIIKKMVFNGVVTEIDIHYSIEVI